MLCKQICCLHHTWKLLQLPCSLCHEVCYKVASLKKIFIEFNSLEHCSATSTLPESDVTFLPFWCCFLLPLFWWREWRGYRGAGKEVGDKANAKKEGLQSCPSRKGWIETKQQEHQMTKTFYGRYGTLEGGQETFIKCNNQISEPWIHCSRIGTHVIWVAWT